MLEEKAKKISELLKVLANENRLLILCTLRDGSKSVGAIAEKIPGITLSALSQHLSALKAHGILESEKHGQSVYYHIKDTRVTQVLEVLRVHYCD